MVEGSPPGQVVIGGSDDQKKNLILIMWGNVFGALLGLIAEMCHVYKNPSV